MTVISEADLRAQLRRPTRGAVIDVPAGASLTPSARDFIKEWGLQVREILTEDVAAGRPGWLRESVFPVVKAEQPPRCGTCQGEITRKPDALTQLNATQFVHKTHPRIRLRGQADSLHALVLMAQAQSTVSGPRWLTEALGVLAAYCRELTSAEYNERPAAALELPGWDEKAIHKATHDPDGVLGVPHATIDGTSPILMHWLNLCRTHCRELELTALDTFPDPEHPYGPSLNHALNRLSSAFYLLQLRLGEGEE
ncbi:MAG: hypothetical protein Q4D89_10575 [Arachnia propionica]|uniref:hypothetical protein n=1 Tax=Arachnia propionica TaxID=1750 RepID=UPI0026FF08CC|nr:hypothetical protein [Arachnia propionica]